MNTLGINFDEILTGMAGGDMPMETVAADILAAGRGVDAFAFASNRWLNGVCGFGSDMDVLAEAGAALPAVTALIAEGSAVDYWQLAREEIKLLPACECDEDEDATFDFTAVTDDVEAPAVDIADIELPLAA